MPTSPLGHEETSFIFSNPTTAFGEHQSYDTTIPFLDENRPSSASGKSFDTPSRRARNWSRLSERRAADNQSTVTVNPFFTFHTEQFSSSFQLYQPKTHVKYAPVSQVLTRQNSIATSIPSKSK